MKKNILFKLKIWVKNDYYFDRGSISINERNFYKCKLAYNKQEDGKVQLEVSNKNKTKKFIRTVSLASIIHSSKECRSRSFSNRYFIYWAKQ